jgi:hypothetical protein
LVRLNELLRAGEGMVDSDQLEMSFDRAGKAFANEQRFPFVVEVPVAANGLDIELNGRIIGFHKTRSTPPRHGRTIWRNEQRYYRWCFSDLETARAFVEQFGGAFHKTTGT